MLKLRLQRTGKVGQPSFRIVLQEHTNPVKREAKEILGSYRPADEGKPFQIDLERVKFWLSKGVQVSDSLAVLLKKQGVEGLDKFIEPRDKKRKSKKEPKEAPVPQAAPAPVAEPAQAEAPEAPAVEPAPVETPTPEAPAVESAPVVEATPEAPAVESAPAETPAPEAPQA